MSPRRWDEWAPCKVPLQRVPNAFDLPNGLTVHEGIVADVKWADRRWRQLGGPKFWLVRARDTGSYNCRNSVAHSRAIGIDFNWSTNGMTSKQTPCPGDMPVAFFEECWEPIGYGWGANWRSKCDRMHISKVPNEGGDGWLYVVHDEGEEDELSERAEEQIEQLVIGMFEKNPEKAGDASGRGDFGSVFNGVVLIRNMLRAHDLRLSVLAGEDKARDMRAITILEELRERPPGGVSETDASAVVDEFFRRLEA